MIWNKPTFFLGAVSVGARVAAKRVSDEESVCVLTRQPWKTVGGVKVGSLNLVEIGVPAYRAGIFGESLHGSPKEARSS